MKFIKVNRLNEYAFINKAHHNDAGFDIRACLSKEIYPDQKLTIPSMEWRTIPTGISLCMPDDIHAVIRSRSGLAWNAGVFVLNSPGTIDSGYLGEIKVILMNLGKNDYIIRNGTRIAQIVFINNPNVCIFGEGIDHNLNNPTPRNEKGFGSTGM